MDDLKNRFRETADEIEAGVREWRDKGVEFIQNNPGTAVGIALGIGLLAGLFMASRAKDRG